MKELLRVEGVSKIYGHSRVLNNINFTLNAGEVHCLVGENGAGKSTFIKILSGAVSPNEGRITVDERSYSSLNPSLSMQLGIMAIYQDVELIDVLTVADNIFLGSEKVKQLGVVDARLQVEKAREILNRLKLNIDPNMLVEDLTAAQKQTLQIVKALHSKCKVLIMDEPTSSLGIEETKALMQMVRDLKAEGIGIIYISHYLEEIFEIGDRITILKDGQYEGTYVTKEVTVQEVIRKMVGRDASLFYQRERGHIGETALEIKDFNAGNTVKNVSFSVRRGEIFGIGGLVGSGRTELANLIVGIDKKDSGKIVLNGREIVIKNPRQAIKNGFCLITEDRKTHALFMDRPVIENIMLVASEQESGPLIQEKKELKSFKDTVGKLSIVLSGPQQAAGSLSGGNQQKTVIARWLLSNCEVFLFDEPTKGVDIGAKEEIYKMMNEMAKSGKIIIMISSDMPELLSMSDRIAVMRDGAMTNILDNVKEEELIQYFLGVK